MQKNPLLDFVESKFIDNENYYNLRFRVNDDKFIKFIKKLEKCVINKCISAKKKYSTETLMIILKNLFFQIYNENDNTYITLNHHNNII